MEKNEMTLTHAEALEAWRIIGGANLGWIVRFRRGMGYYEADEFCKKACQTVRRVTEGILVGAGAAPEKARTLSDAACGRGCWNLPGIFREGFFFYRDPVEYQGWQDPIAMFLDEMGGCGYDVAGFVALGILAGDDENDNSPEHCRLILGKHVRRGLRRDLLEETAFFCDCEEFEEKPKSTLHAVRKVIREFVREWDECAGGTPVSQTRYLGILRDFACSQFRGYLLWDDKEYLRLLPLLSLIFTAGRENRFISATGNEFYGLVVAEAYEAESPHAARMLLDGAEGEEASALKWALGVITGMPAFPDSAVLRSYPGWEARDGRIFLRRLCARADDEGDGDNEAILLPSAEWFVATLVAEALLSQGGR